MRYDSIRMNLSVSKDYQPNLPRVMKWNKLASVIAGDVSTFVDDRRVAGFNFENACQVGHQVSSLLQYLGKNHLAKDAPESRVW
jgi:hypothetical protein